MPSTLKEAYKNIYDPYNQTKHGSLMSTNTMSLRNEYYNSNRDFNNDYYFNDNSIKKFN